MIKKTLWLFVICLMLPAKNGRAWGEIYQQIVDTYVYTTSAEDLAIAALKGLNKVDGKLNVGNDSSRITLYFDGKVVEVLRKPEKNDYKKWGDITEKMIEAAIESSRKASSRDFEITDILAQEAVKILDKDSKFFANEDEAAFVNLRNKRLFAARVENEVLFLRVAAFNKQTFAEIKTALSEYSSAKALIIDLRNCPGGMPGEAIKTVDLFLDSGIIASSKGRSDTEETFYTADEDIIWKNKPIFILVDGETASAAEILAAAMKDQGLAQIIGTKTKGKGTMQKLIGLKTGAVLAITNGFFKTPSGKNIDNVAIRPNVCTFEMPENKNIENLLGQQDGVCLSENREDGVLEEKVAEFIINETFN